MSANPPPGRVTTGADIARALTEHVNGLDNLDASVRDELFACVAAAHWWKRQKQRVDVWEERVDPWIRVSLACGLYTGAGWGPDRKKAALRAAVNCSALGRWAARLNV